MIRAFVLLIALGAAAFVAGQGQTPTRFPDDSGDFQLWNDVTVTKSVSKRIDLVIPLTLRLGKNVTRLQEKRIGIAFAIKPHKRLTITPGYNFIHSRNAIGNLIRENRLTFAATVRFPVEKVGLSHRSLLEYRIRTTGKTFRYRPSITVEKELPERWIKGTKAFATNEVFYDSGAKRLTRNRLMLGFNKVLNKKLSVDIYYVRQDDSVSLVSPFHAVGSHWRLRL